MTKFLLVRHAATDFIGRKLCGRMEGIPLNEEGLTQANALAIQLSSHNIHAVYSSPLERAIQTARPLCDLQHLTVQIDESFTELDFGDWTNVNWSELGDDANFGYFNSFRSNTRIPGGEWLPEAQIRFVNGMRRLLVKHQGQTVAIFSHADMIKAAITYYAGIPIDLMHRISIHPASVSIVELDDAYVQVVCINQTMGMI